jgi:transcription antitermination factor NusG
MDNTDYPERGESVRVISGTLRNVRGTVMSTEPDRDYVWLRVQLPHMTYQAPYRRAEIERDPRP